MSLISSFLNNGGTLDDLKERYAISSTRHKTYPNLILFKYNQIESPFAEAIVREARGLILDEADNWKIIFKGFEKFFNSAEHLAAKINWENATIYEKCDGSFVGVYFYNNSWNFCTTGSPDASGPVGDFGITFAQLFVDTFNKMGLKFPENTNLWPMFELIGPMNKVVVDHKQASLIFINLRNAVTHNELPLTTIPEYPAVKSFPFSSLEDVLSAVSKLNGSEQEGFVVYDGVSRIKVKSNDYVLKHHLRSSWSLRHAVEIVIKNEINETISYFPEFAEQLTNIKEKYNDLMETICNDFERLKSIDTQKAFAFEAVKTNCSGALFMLRAGKVNSVQEYFANINVDKVIGLLGLKNGESNEE